MTKRQDLRAQTVLGDPVVFVVPLRPLLPLVTTHPAEHQWNAHLVGHLHDAVAGELALQPNHVEPEIFYVAHGRGVAGGIVGEQQVGCVRGAAYQKVPAVDRQIEASALAQFRELVVIVAMLGDGANAEPQMASVGRPVELAEFQLQVIQIGLAECVGPPKVWIGDRKRAESCGVERDLPVLPRGEGDRLFDLYVRLAGPGDGGAKNTTDLLHRGIAQAGVDGESRGIGSRQRKFGVHRGGTKNHRTGNPQIDRLPYSCIAVWDKGIAGGLAPSRPLISELFPVDPVVPAVGQFDTVDVLQRLLRSDLDGQCVRSALVDPP